MRSTGLSTLVAAAALSLTAALGPLGHAHADCASPPFEVLWTYPADGDQDVPINAQLWVLTSAWANALSASLNGTELTAISRSGGTTAIDPGRLDPDTDYVLELTYQTIETDGALDRVVELAFRTDSGGIVPTGRSAPAVTGHTSQTGFADHDCADAIGVQGCFDTGEDTLLTFYTQDEDALGWLVQTASRGPGILWPARCGDPAVYGYGMALLNACYEIRAIGPGGVASEPRRYCPATGALDDGGVPQASDAGIDPAAHDAGVRDPQTTNPPTALGADASTPAHGDAGTHMASGADEPDSDPIGNGSTTKGGDDQSSSCSVASNTVGSRSSVSSVPVLALLLTPALFLGRRRRARRLEPRTRSL